ncbi:mobilization protein [Arenibacter aquaticus]|uniref:Mobilization protein n=1 Tax=Arenibacter aquaticus TaxID=2489054 RepID=A0A430K521_9FLAO|nr:MobB family relaxase [Arenibacter aquaticus]RTE54127.1 mobilization protein [Arenibacter aquaticus]
MYISITKQHLNETFSQSCSDFVAYLQKENEGKQPELQEHFFGRRHDRIDPEKVIKEIDGNTAKLKKREPKFFSITINPSKRELKHINNDPKLLKQYVREVMKDYAASFYRDRPVSVNNIKYYAKVEYERTFKGFDKEVKENQPYRAKIVKLEHDLRKVERGELTTDVKSIKKKIARLNKNIPHRINGEVVAQGMKKPGLQTHVHIIVSRKDISNRYSLSPGSKYRESETVLNGKIVKRGFNRDRFYAAAEKRFDTLFKYNRNYVESYSAHKAFVKDPKKYFAHLLGLPVNERSAAFKILGTAGVQVPRLNIPTNKVEVALKAIKQFKKTVDVAKSSSTIGL